MKRWHHLVKSLFQRLFFKGSFAILNPMPLICRERLKAQSAENRQGCHLNVMEYAAVSAFIYIILAADGNVFLPISGG
jgi:hypothetical protein